MTEKKERTLIVAWFIINLAISLWIVRDYGLSYDEPDFYRYANYSLDAYKSFFGLLHEPDFGFFNLIYYGPAFILIVNSIVKISYWIPVDFNEIHIWHYAYFISFQLTGLCLYSLTKRWFARWTAWAVLVLFITQPILWGHAFINPKDIPFMFFFTFSVWTGYQLVDSVGGTAVSLTINKDVLKGIRKRWASIETRKKQTLVLLSLVIVLGLVLSQSLANTVIERVVSFFYYAAPDSWAGRIMQNFAEYVSRIPVELYVAKGQGLYARFELIVFFLGFVIIGGYLIVLLTNTSLFAYGKRFWHRSIEKKGWQRASAFARRTVIALKTPKVIFAGIVLGLTISIRVLGPIAGLIVLLVLWIQIRNRAYPLMLAYILWAGLIMYLTWPNLWLSPVVNFYKSLRLMSNFPWQGEVLFNGQFYAASNLPVTYLPVLLNIKFTEIFIFFLYLGFGFFVWQIIRKDVRVDLLLYVGLGFFLPIFYLIISRAPLYDNIRQILFLLPASFIIAAFALDALIGKIQKQWLRLSLIILIVSSGLISLVQLHPYQYIYYNAFIGGVEGAFRRFELDYWFTSSNELTTWINENAEYGSRVVVYNLPYFVDVQLRPDIKVKKIRKSAINMNGDYDYAILTTRWNADEYFPDAEIITFVERDGGILGVLKDVKGQKLE
jgi:hypothetical protein